MYITDEWYTRFRVSWDPSPSPVLGYKIVYKPVGKKACSFQTYHFQNSEWLMGDLNRNHTYHEMFVLKDFFLFFAY